MSFLDKLAENFSFKSLWNDVGRWVLPGGLLIDFLVDKLEQREQQEALTQIAQTSAINMGFSDPSPAPQFQAEREFVTMTRGPALAQSIDATYERILSNEHDSLQARNESAEYAGDPLNSNELTRMLSLEKLFKGAGPSAEDLARFAQEEIEQKGGNPQTIESVLGNGQKGLLVFDTVQATILARELDNASANLSNQNGELVPAAVTLPTAGIMLARLNDLAYMNDQAVGILVQPNARGDFELHAKTAPEMLQDIEQARQSQNATTLPVAGLQRLQEKDELSR